MMAGNNDEQEKAVKTLVNVEETDEEQKKEKKGGNAALKNSSENKTINMEERNVDLGEILIEVNDSPPSSFSSRRTSSSTSTVSSYFKSGQHRPSTRSSKEPSSNDEAVVEVVMVTDEGEEKTVEEQSEKSGKRSSTGTTSEVDLTLTSDRHGNPLFPMRGSSKSCWEIVRLVAKKGTDMSKVKSSDAIRAFCLLCHREIAFSKGNGNSVFRHVAKEHGAKLKELEESLSEPDQKKMKPTDLTNFFSTARRKEDMKFLPFDEQLTGECLLVRWISSSLRPFRIVEDPEFIEYSKFLCLVRGQFKVPSRRKITKQTMDLADYLMKTVKNNLKSEMDYFSVTTDIWSSRLMQSFMALTLHYITRDFEMKSAVIEVRPLTGSHTG